MLFLPNKYSCYYLSSDHILLVIVHVSDHVLLVIVHMSDHILLVIVHVSDHVLLVIVHIDGLGHTPSNSEFKKKKKIPQNDT